MTRSNSRTVYLFGYPDSATSSWRPDYFTVLLLVTWSTSRRVEPRGNPCYLTLRLVSRFVVPPHPFACLFRIVVSSKVVSKWSSEDVKFLEVYEESQGLWNIRHSDYNKIKRDSAMLKLMGKLLKRNVAVESVEVLRKKIKSIKKTCTGKSLRRWKN
jgi:hypothetical protein